MNFCFKDERLNKRANSIFSKLKRDPKLSFPQMFNRSEELEGFYRFFNNSRIELDEIKDAIISETKSKMNCVEAIAVHDTTHVGPASKASTIDEFQMSNGFFAHVSILVDSQSLRRIHGTGAIHIWSRVKKRKKKNSTGEQYRWVNHVNEMEADFAGVSLVHIMDREGDSSAIWSNLINDERRFVIRVKNNRKVKSEKDKNARLIGEMRHAAVIAKREITLSKRDVSPCPRSAYKARATRTATLKISAKSVEVHKTDKYGNTINQTVRLNVVRVFEDRKREGSIEWLLLTTEPIETKKQVLRIVDFYKARWVIEEFFKGVKTGCRLEERLFDSADAWYKLFALSLPIGTTLLNMRLNKQEKLDSFLTKPQKKILQLKAQEIRQRIESNEDALYQIARLGGHIKANGPPGWLTLQRGYEQLLLLEIGWVLAKRKKCDE